MGGTEGVHTYIIRSNNRKYYYLRIKYSELYYIIYNVIKSKKSNPIRNPLEKDPNPDLRLENI